LADRKKVHKIRTKNTVKFKASKRNSVSSINKKTQPIKMNSQKDERIFENNHKESDFPRKKRESVVSKKTVKPIDKEKGSTDYKKSEKFSVINGNKSHNNKKRLLTVCISFILICSILIFYFTSPTGPIERITNAFAVMGSGEYPAVLTGTNVLSFQTVDEKIFALTNSHLCGYDFSGKNFLQLQHNFSNPILDVSEERTLIYNRESNKFIIANNSGSVFEQSLEQSVYCADISYNGSVAFACDSTSYSAGIFVFDKNMKQFYTWYLADGLVSDITVSDDGEYIALAVLKVKNGVFSSEIYCLDTAEKEPIFVKELSDETVLKIESVSSSAFVYVSDKKVSFVEWETGEIINKNNFNAPSYLTNASDYYIALFGEANHSDIVLFNSEGEIEHQFEYNGIIDDISIFDETVYVLSGNKITYYNFLKTDNKVITLESKPDYILGVDNGFLSVNNINIDFSSATFEK